MCLKIGYSMETGGKNTGGIVEAAALAHFISKNIMTSVSFYKKKSYVSFYSVLFTLKVCKNSTPYT